MLAAPPGLDHQQHTVGEEEEQEKEEEEEEGTLRFFNNTAGPQVLLQVCETKPEASTTPPTVSETLPLSQPSAP